MYSKGMRQYESATCPRDKQTTAKGHDYKIYFVSEYNGHPSYIPLGDLYQVNHRQYGMHGLFHSEQINTVYDNRIMEDVVDEMFKKYGHGECWVTHQEIVVRA